jgi:hypothetical protein
VTSELAVGRVQLGGESGTLVRQASGLVELYVQDVLAASWDRGCLTITTCGRTWLSTPALTHHLMVALYAFAQAPAPRRVQCHA